MQSSAGQGRRRLQIWNLGEDQVGPWADAPNERGARIASSATSEISAEETGEDDYSACMRALNEGPQPIELDCLCQLPNGFDRGCRTTTIGPQSVDVVYRDALGKNDARGRLDDGLLRGTVHIDLDRVGLFHGALTAQSSEGFHVAVDPKFSGLLLTKLAHYMSRDLPPKQEQRGGESLPSPSERIVPTSAFCTYRDQHGVLYKASLINVSRIDAMVKTRTLPEVNSLITFCGRRQRRAHVIRRFETGFAALFVDPLVEQEFSPDIRLTDEFPGYP